MFDQILLPFQEFESGICCPVCGAPSLMSAYLIWSYNLGADRIQNTISKNAFNCFGCHCLAMGWVLSLL
jgi:hypothetical protein